MPSKKVKKQKNNGKYLHARWKWLRQIYLKLDEIDERLKTLEEKCGIKP